jgi:hypothetical protein
MSFLDPYDITNPGAITPPVNSLAEKSLNEEVSQVVGQLGSWWGGFKKQSQTVLVSARKDFSDVVISAQKELGKLTTESPQTASSSSSELQQQTPAQDSSSDSSTPTEKGSNPEDLNAPPTPSASSSTSFQGLLGRLQSTIPPNVVSAVQNSLPESIRHATSEGVDFAQLRSTVLSEFQRVQGVTRAQAEEYVHKSEAFLKEAVKEAQEVLKDAVKVIPPDAQADPSSSSSAMIWDGSDVWMIPSTVSAAPDPASTGSSREGSTATSAVDAQLAVTTRTESLLNTLKHNPEIVAHDPESDDVVKKLYMDWLEEEGQKKDQTESEAEYWVAKGKAALAQPNDGQALQSTYDQLVPSRLSEDIFWKRYFFRVHQIECDEEKRKALLQGSLETEENIAWEEEDDEEEDDEDEDSDDDEEEEDEPAPVTQTQAKPATATQEAITLAKPQATPQTLVAHTPVNASPRASSDESYDVVSSTNSASGDPKKPKVEEGDDGDGDGDGDEEENSEDEDEDEDEEGSEGDSDWE